MKYLSISLRTLMIITQALSFYATATISTASIPHDSLRRISEVYHRSIRAFTGLRGLTDQEIELALRFLLEGERAPLPSCEQSLNCYPTVNRTLTEMETIKDMLHAQSPRIAAINGFYSISASSLSSLQLHRCPGSDGICDNAHHRCYANATETINVDVTVRTHNASFMEQVQLVNHTSCFAYSVQCICPSPFTNVSHNSLETPCHCDCAAGRESECQQIRSGSSSLNWEGSSLSRHFDVADLYKRCQDKSVDGRWLRRTYSLVLKYCPKMNCDEGLVFNVTTLKCSGRRPTIAIGDDEEEEYRNVRGVNPEDGPELPSPDNQPVSTAEPNKLQSNKRPVLQTTTRRSITKKTKKRQLHLKRKAERKLRYIQTKGLENVQADSQIGRKIYEEYRRLYLEKVAPPNTQSCKNPGDIIFNVHKQVQVTCKTLPKDDYFILPVEDHVIFCSLDVP